MVTVWCCSCCVALQPDDCVVTVGDCVTDGDCVLPMVTVLCCSFCVPLQPDDCVVAVGDCVTDGDSVLQMMTLCCVAAVVFHNSLMTMLLQLVTLCYSC